MIMFHREVISVALLGIAVWPMFTSLRKNNKVRKNEYRDTGYDHVLQRGDIDGSAWHSCVAHVY